MEWGGGGGGGLSAFEGGQRKEDIFFGLPYEHCAIYEIVSPFKINNIKVHTFFS